MAAGNQAPAFLIPSELLSQQRYTTRNPLWKPFKRGTGAGRAQQEPAAHRARSFAPAACLCAAPGLTLCSAVCWPCWGLPLTPESPSLTQIQHKNTALSSTSVFAYRLSLCPCPLSPSRADHIGAESLCEAAKLRPRLLQEAFLPLLQGASGGSPPSAGQTLAERHQCWILGDFCRCSSTSGGDESPRGATLSTKGRYFHLDCLKLLFTLV